MSSGGSGGGGNTTNTVQAVPQFEQQASQNNQALAASIGSQPYPTYNAPLVQGFSDNQVQGQNQAIQAAGSYQPDLNAATGLVDQSLQTNASTPGAVQAFMNPYLQSSLQPQIQDLNTQLGLQQSQIDSQATQAGAFGDARQGAQSALANYYGDQSLNSLVSNGYNTAYNNAVQGLQQQQNADMTGANAMSALGGQQQSLGLAGAGAVYNVGQQQQQLGQQQLNTAYQQYLNQVNWPIQMLNVQESALSNNPYQAQTAVQLPNANSTAQGFGALAGLSGLLGGASGGSGGRTNVFGSA